MTEANDDKKPNPQEKLREIIRTEITQLRDETPARRPARSIVISTLLGGAFIFTLVGGLSLALYGSVHIAKTLPIESTTQQSFKDITINPKFFQETHALEFIVGANAALMVYTDHKTESAELSKAIEVFSKRRDHDIGEAMGAVPTNKSGKLLDREATLEAFELSLGYLSEGSAVPRFGLLGADAQPLSKDTSIREERLINKIQKVIEGTGSPTEMVGQVKKLNAFWHESEYYGEEDSNQARSNYKVMSERILRRLDNSQG